MASGAHEEEAQRQLSKKHNDTQRREKQERQATKGTMSRGEV